MKEPTRFEDHSLTNDEREHAARLINAMVKMGYAIPQMANILGEMGKQLVVHSDGVVNDIKGRLQ